jgi:hypothetical protein
MPTEPYFHEIDHALSVWQHCVLRDGNAVGWPRRSILAGIVEYSGAPPRLPVGQHIDPAIQEWPPVALAIENTLTRMVKERMERLALVVRMTYIKLPRSTCAERARRLGVSRVQYYSELNLAKAFLSGALKK